MAFSRSPEAHAVSPIVFSTSRIVLSTSEKFFTEAVAAATTGTVIDFVNVLPIFPREEDKVSHFLLVASSEDCTEESDDAKSFTSADILTDKV